MTPEAEDYRNNGHPIFYRGPSMRPLFRDLDRLFIAPLKEGRIMPGDVLFFYAPDTGSPVVHRVVSCRHGEIHTRGDNNREMDPFFLTRADIQGKVTAVHRRGRSLRVINGPPGLVVHHLIQVTSRLLLKARHMAGPLWRGLVFFRPLRWVRFFLPEIRIRSYQKPQGEEVLLMIGFFAVARRKRPGTLWKINRFFQLVFDPEALFRKDEKRP
jgi:hypothetical protein